MKPSEDWNKDTPERAERAIGYSFKDKALLKTGFTHKSYAHITGEESNERLEFLGDAVIQFIVTEALFKNSVKDEGRMTEERQQYVSRDALGSAAKRARLIEFMRYAGGDDTLGGKTPCNLFEAVTAGIYLDGGIRAVRAFLKRFVVNADTENYKTQLQEYVQQRSKRLPVYAVKEASGGFECTVSALGKRARGAGKSKKAAESAAAMALLQKLNESNRKAEERKH